MRFFFFFSEVVQADVHVRLVSTVSSDHNQNLPEINECPDTRSGWWEMAGAEQPTNPSVFAQCCRFTKPKVSVEAIPGLAGRLLENRVKVRIVMGFGELRS